MDCWIKPFLSDNRNKNPRVLWKSLVNICEDLPQQPATERTEKPTLNGRFQFVSGDRIHPWNFNQGEA